MRARGFVDPALFGEVPSETVCVYDVFGMIPPPGENDGPDVHARYDVIVSGHARGLGGDDTYYGYQPELRASVERSLARLGFPVERNAVRLVQGPREDT